MTNGDQKDPTWKPGDLKADVPSKIKLKSAKPVAEGSNNYGEWHMWTVEVEEAVVRTREKPKEKVENYTGPAICFPSEKLHEDFLKHTGGTQEGVVLEVTKKAKEREGTGFYTVYEVTLVEGGTTPPNNLLISQNNYINDFKLYVKKNLIGNNKEEFIGFGTSDTYSLDKETLEKLWKVYNEK